MQKNTTIDSKVSALVMDGLAALDEERMREDLMGLFMDIRLDLRVKAQDKEKQIYAYAALLQEELELYSPYKAFEAGALLGSNPTDADKDKARAFMRYVCRTEFDPTSKTIHDKIASMYHELYELLGDTHNLIDEFTELYRKCYGIIRDKLEVFFNMGYASTL